MDGRARFQYTRVWLQPLLAALVMRVLLLSGGGLAFHSDEAVVGLMARHINQGQPIPIFFYDQPYMGSLDPLLVALAFRVMGESVLAIRVVQTILFIVLVALTTGFTLRLTNRADTAHMAGWLMAIPPVVMTLYSSVSLGGYGEVMMIGMALLWIGYDLAEGHGDPRWRWPALGALLGLGWWTHNLIVAFAIPVAVSLLIRWRTVRWRWMPVSLPALAIFSLPWWLFNLTNNWESVRFLTGGLRPDLAADTFAAVKLPAFFLLGIPALLGIRYPWALDLWAGIWSIPFVGLLLFLLVPNAWQSVRQGGPTRFLWIMAGGFSLLFVLSSFGVDATGRYLLPLVVPLCILLAVQITRLADRYWAAYFLAAVIIGTHAVGTYLAAQTVPPGLSTQFDPATDIPNSHDQPLIDFLQAHDERFVYTTYWVAYRIAFLSHEEITLSPQLPYKASLEHTPSDRYPPYTERVNSADRAAFVTANLPQLDQALEAGFIAAGVEFKKQTIGPYTVYYDLSRKVTPAELGFR